jgi:Eukaryotic aspartyl protease
MVRRALKCCCYLLFVPVVLAHCSSGPSNAPDGGADDAATKRTVDGSTDADAGSPLVAIPMVGCSVAPTTGFPNSDSTYSVPVTIDDQISNLVVDTGSTTLVVAEDSCTTCSSVSPSFNPPNGSCSGSTSQSYDTGHESYDGQICTGQVAVGEQMPAVAVSFAGVTSQSGTLYPYTCNSGPVPQQGVLGLGPLALDTIGEQSSDSYFSALVGAGVPNIFATLLCTTGGTLWFGGYDPTYASSDPQYTPLSLDGGFYGIAVQAIGLGTQNFASPVDPVANPTTVDTGSNAFFVISSVYASLLAVSDPGFTTVFGASTLGAIFAQGPCVPFNGSQTSAQIDAALPPLTLKLPEATDPTTSFTLSLPATESYLMQVEGGSNPQYCLMLADYADLDESALLGAAALRANITIFDVGNNRIGFAPQSHCE